MRHLVSIIAFAALAAPTLAQAQIAEIDLPPSDVADADAVDAGYGDDDLGYDDESYDDEDYNDAVGDASGRIADILDDPRRQEDIADAMSDMLRALMTIRVGPIVDAARRIDPDADIAAAADRDATIGDIASRGDPDYEDRLEDGIRSGTAVSGTMIREFAKMMPALIAVAKDLGAQAEKAMREPPRK